MRTFRVRLRRRIRNHLQRKFLAGTLAAIPLVLTAFVLWWVDSKVRQVFHVDHPFLGIAVAVAGLYALGLFITSFLGRFFLHLLDIVLTHIPGLRDLYVSWKQVAFTPDGDTGMFSQVVLMPGENAHTLVLGFTSGKPVENTTDTLCVYVPAAPNPTIGRLFFVSRRDCRSLSLAPKDALKFIVSGGNYVPSQIATALATDAKKAPFPPAT